MPKSAQLKDVFTPKGHKLQSGGEVNILATIKAGEAPDLDTLKLAYGDDIEKRESYYPVVAAAQKDDRIVLQYCSTGKVFILSGKYASFLQVEEDEEEPSAAPTEIQPEEPEQEEEEVIQQEAPHAQSDGKPAEPDFVDTVAGCFRPGQTWGYEIKNGGKVDQARLRIEAVEENSVVLSYPTQQGDKVVWAKGSPINRRNAAQCLIARAAEVLPEVEPS